MSRELRTPAAARLFASAGQARLAKCGLLQAMQVVFGSMQAVAGTLGVGLRSDRLPGGKAGLVSRASTRPTTIGTGRTGRWIPLPR